MPVPSNQPQVVSTTSSRTSATARISRLSISGSAIGRCRSPGGHSTRLSAVINQEVLAGSVHDFCLSYAYNIVIFSRIWEEHLRHITLALGCLQIYGLVCSLEKCNFGRWALAFLGHLIKSPPPTPPNHPHPERAEDTKASPSHRRRSRFGTEWAAAPGRSTRQPKLVTRPNPLTSCSSARTSPKVHRAI